MKIEYATSLTGYPSNAYDLNSRNFTASIGTLSVSRPWIRLHKCLILKCSSNTLSFLRHIDTKTKIAFYHISIIFLIHCSFFIWCLRLIEDLLVGSEIEGAVVKVVIVKPESWSLIRCFIHRFQSGRFPFQWLSGWRNMPIVVVEINRSRMRWILEEKII